jgi:hypothetical protein
MEFIKFHPQNDEIIYREPLFETSSDMARYTRAMS